MIWDKIKEKMNETFKSNVDTEKQDGAIEASDEKTSESEKPHLIVPYAPFVKYIAEKYGLGDAEDFQRRVNAINRFYDNEEIRTNIQILGNKTKGESLGKMKNWDIFHDTNKSKDFWDRLANDFRKSLKSNNLKEFGSEEELVKAMLDKNYVSEVYPEYKKIKQEAKDAMESFSKKGQKVPFKEFDKQMVDPFKNKTIDEVVEMHKKGVLPNKNPRQGVKNATKKFNTIKEAVDVLSNAKLNNVLDLLLTPTPLYEPSMEDIRKKNGLDKLSLSLEAEKPSDNQNE